jgi:peptidoglycan hydrolase-like protein with peptidoglycan-binding domain
MDAGGTQPPAGGDDEVQVEDLQKVLTDAGYEPGAIDGIYGPKTEAAWTAMMADAHSIQTLTLKSTTTEVVSAVTLG